MLALIPLMLLASLLEIAGLSMAAPAFCFHIPTEIAHVLPRNPLAEFRTEAIRFLGAE